jgi:hypothetical protein
MAKKPKQPKQPDHRWRIIHIKGTPAETIGYVYAPDAEAAVEKAIDEFKIGNAQIQQRLVAERIKVQKLR